MTTTERMEQLAEWVKRSDDAKTPEAFATLIVDIVEPKIRRATVERIRERMEAEYTVLYGRGVCLSLLSQVLDEEAARP